MHSKRPMLLSKKDDATACLMSHVSTISTLRTPNIEKLPDGIVFLCYQVVIILSFKKNIIRRLTIQFYAQFKVMLL